MHRAQYARNGESLGRPRLAREAFERALDLYPAAGGGEIALETKRKASA